MRLIWRESALRDLEGAMRYIADRHPRAAAGQFAEIRSQVQGLEMHPYLGRSDRVAGTRELIVSRTPFIVVYVVGDAVELLRILHGAQQWPTGSE